MNSGKVFQSLRLANPWWEGNPIPKQFLPPFKRPQLQKIISYEKLGRIVVIKGPRRTGKTTLIYQYISKLLEKNIDPKTILFASMDDLNLRIPLQQLLESYEIFADLNNSSKKKYLFLDEIQFLPDWSSMAKTITDRDKSIRLIVSGSSASLLVKSSESLSGRTVEETILPFTVREIIQMDQISRKAAFPKQLMQPSSTPLYQLKFNPTLSPYSLEMEKYIQEYIRRGGFPHLFHTKEQSLWLDLLRTDIIHKAIYKDLTELYGLREPLVLEKLFLYLIEATSGIANLSSISQHLKLSRETLSRYINYLINAYLIFPMRKYSSYPKEILKSQEKLHIMDPALSWLSGERNLDSVLESIVASLLLRQRGARLYYWRRNYEVDCVVEMENMLIPIEVKNSDRPFAAQNYRGLLNFMQRYSLRSKLGFIIYNGKAKEIKTANGIIRMLPVWYALSQL